MVTIGKINELQVVKRVDFGVYLDGGDLGEILLPQKYIKVDIKPGDKISVFVYFDSDDRIIATEKVPKAQVGEFAFLKVIDVSRVGVFMDWGLEKDLFVPYREQREKMMKGKSYVVRIYFDEQSNRIAASSKIEKFLDPEPKELEFNQAVKLMITHKTDLGYKAIINNKYQGMIFNDDIFVPIQIGQVHQGYIKKVRSDGKIDLNLVESGYAKIDDFAQKILRILKANQGYLAINDKSKPELIYKLFGMSKKNYKKSIGALYRERLISIEKGGIRLINN
jgi:predicted RNA-binding protein (virulence factor B family)